MLATLVLADRAAAQKTTVSDRRIPVRKDGAPSMMPVRSPMPRDSAFAPMALRDPSRSADSLAALERQRRADSVARVRTRDDSLARMASPRVDALAPMEQRRVDSASTALRRSTDSLATRERARTDSIARVGRDSAAMVMASPEQPPMTRRAGNRFGNRGWYLGLAAGGVSPIQDFKDLGYGSGYTIHVPIGWHARSSPIGARLDLGYSQFQGRTLIAPRTDQSVVTLSNSDPRVLSAMLNVTLGIPLIPSRALGLYAVGGAGLQHFRSFGRVSALSGYLGNDVLDANDQPFSSTRNKLAWQAGGGVDFLIGSTSVFVESRFVNMYADRGNNLSINDFFGSRRANQLRWVPITLGITLH